MHIAVFVKTNKVRYAGFWRSNRISIYISQSLQYRFCCKKSLAKIIRTQSLSSYYLLLVTLPRFVGSAVNDCRNSVASEFIRIAKRPRQQVMLAHCALHRAPCAHFRCLCPLRTICKNASRFCPLLLAVSRVSRVRHAKRGCIGNAQHR